MSLQALVEDVRQNVGLELQPSNEGVCAFSLEIEGQSIVITLEMAEDRAYVYASIGKICEAQTATFKMFLNANMLGQETFGGVLAVDPVLDEAFIYHTIALELLNSNALLKKVSAIVQGYKQWHHYLENVEKAVNEDVPTKGFIKI